MTKRRKSEKTIEIHEVFVIRTGSGSLPALCTECSTDDAIMVGPEQAAVLARVPVRMIYRWLELGLVHFKEEANDSLIVCLKSLPVNGNQNEQ